MCRLRVNISVLVLVRGRSWGCVRTPDLSQSPAAAPWPCQGRALAASRLQSQFATIPDSQSESSEGRREESTCYSPQPGTVKSINSEELQSAVDQSLRSSDKLGSTYLSAKIIDTSLARRDVRDRVSTQIAAFFWHFCNPELLFLLRILPYLTSHRDRIAAFIDFSEKLNFYVLLFSSINYALS